MRVHCGRFTSCRGELGEKGGFAYHGQAEGKVVVPEVAKVFPDIEFRACAEEDDAEGEAGDDGDDAGLRGAGYDFGGRGGGIGEERVRGFRGGDCGDGGVRKGRALGWNILHVRLLGGLVKSQVAIVFSVVGFATFETGGSIMAVAWMMRNVCSDGTQRGTWRCIPVPCAWNVCVR